MNEIRAFLYPSLARKVCVSKDVADELQRRIATKKLDEIQNYKNNAVQQ